jgi:CubicO group peptidase (beta-lactamase class C family)
MELATPAGQVAARGLPAPVPRGGGLEIIERALIGEVDAERLPGAVVMLWREGRPLYACAVGWLDAARRHPMRSDALFRIFSMTKPLVSVAALQLVEAGRLRLDDEVIDHLPLFGHPRVTVRHLLMHTAGLCYGPRQRTAALRAAYARRGLGFHPRDMAAEDFLRALSQVPLTAPPGTQWDYGYSSDVLGLLIEAVSGRGLADHLHETLFRPLGMADTAFAIAPGQAQRLAQPYARDPVDGSPLLVPDQTFDPCLAPRMASGGAGLISTAGDYGRFANRLLAGDSPLLHPDLLRPMLSDQLGPLGVHADPSPGESALLSPGYGFGLGCFAVRLPGDAANLPGHAGSYLWSGTAGTLFWVDPQLQLVAVYMSQAPGASRQHYRRWVMQLVYAALQG